MVERFEPTADMDVVREKSEKFYNVVKTTETPAPIAYSKDQKRKLYMKNKSHSTLPKRA